MSLESILFATLCLSVFFLGIAIGGVIEYRRTARKLEEQKNVIQQNHDMTLAGISTIYDKLYLINKRCRYNVDAIQKIATHLETCDPNATMLIELPKERKRVHTPPLPYRVGCLNDDD